MIPLNDFRLASPLFDLRWQGLLFSLGAVATVTAVLFALKLEAYNVNMVYMLVTLAVTVWFGLTAGVITAVLAFFCFDYFFIPPFFTFVISASEGWSAVFLFLVTAIAANQIAGRARFNSYQAQKRTAEINVLYELATTVITTIDKTKMLERVLEQVSQATQTCSCTLFLSDSKNEDGGLALAARIENRVIGGPTYPEPDLATAWLVFEQNQPMFYAALSAGLIAAASKFSYKNTYNLTQANLRGGPIAYLPLATGPTVLGVLVLVGLNSLPHLEFSSEEKRLLTVLANHVALAVEHARLIEETTQIAALRESDKLKSALLASVSHELRTPLTSIKTATANLLVKDIEWTGEQQQEFLGVIEAETDRLSNLVSNLLDLTKIEAGVLLPDFGWYYLPEIVEEVATRLRKSFLLKNHPLAIIFSADIPLNRMDYLQIDQVLTNLIENAAKYSPPSHAITVEVSVENAATVVALQAENLGSNALDVLSFLPSPTIKTVTPPQLGLLVKVIDEGCGVPVEQRERIFDKFFRISNTANQLTSKIPGTGIGLAISKGIIDAHAGQIWVGNRLGGGSIFYFSLPVVLLNEEWLETGTSTFE